MPAEVEVSAIVSGVTSIFTSLGSVATWVWSLFSDFLDMIIENPLILIPVAFAVLAGGIAVVLRMVRKFGLKGKH